MAGWFGGGSSALDEQINRATQSSLEDIATNLEISDLIRSKTVPARDAMRSLKKRLANPNPNVQLATLKLTDTCVKNGGNHFLVEIASREFMDNLTSLLRVGGGAVTNQDVKEKILALIQVWAGVAGFKPEATYIGETYRSLQREGFHFPPREELASAVFESNAPPEWINSEVCMRCRSEFTFTNRRHHCRNCGRIFDQRCSSKTLPLPHLGIMTPVRVDDGCYEMLTKKGNSGSNSFTGEGGHAALHRSASDRSFSHSSRYRPSAPLQARDARVTDNFDEDLKKALAMSLDEVKSYSSGYVPNNQVQPPRRSSSHKQYSSSNRVVSPIKETPPVEEADEDLAAAIAASLKDMEQQKARHAESMKQQKDKAVDADSKFMLPSSKYDLSPAEAENINLFSNLVDRLQNQPRGAILREPQIQELYETIGSMRPKLARSYGETMSKHETLLDLHSKLSTVVRYYDKMLEDRLTRTYANHNLNGYAGMGQSNQYSNVHSSYAPVPLSYNPNTSSVESFYSSNPPAHSMANGYGTAPQQPYANQAPQYAVPPAQAYQQGYQPPSHSQTQDPYAQQQQQQQQQQAPGHQYPTLPMHRVDSHPTEPVSPPQSFSTPHQSQPPQAQAQDAMSGVSQPSSAMESPYQNPNSADSFYRTEPPQQQPQAQYEMGTPLHRQESYSSQPQMYHPPQQGQQPQPEPVYNQQTPQAQQPQPVYNTSAPPQQVQPTPIPQQNQPTYANPQQPTYPPQQYQPQSQSQAHQQPQSQPQAYHQPQQQHQTPEHQFYTQHVAPPQTFQPQQQQYSKASAYQASAFPAVPQHQLPQHEIAPPKEEALIEL